jgi:hypothetical protein
MSLEQTKPATPLLTEEQAAQLLNLSVRTLQAWRLQNFGPRFVRAGGEIRYARADIEA